MSDEQNLRPRRALSPSEYTGEPDSPVLATRRMEPIDFEDDTPTGAASFLTASKLAKNTSADPSKTRLPLPLNSPSQPVPPTPVPPPTASHIGRRLSALSATDDIDYDDIFVAVPRRSAASFTSPDEPFCSDSAQNTSNTEKEDKNSSLSGEEEQIKSRPGRAILVVVLTLLLAVGISLTVFFVNRPNQSSFEPTVTPTPTQTEINYLDTLLTAHDLALLDAETQWQVSPAQNLDGDEDPNMACLDGSSTKVAAIQRWKVSAKSGLNVTQQLLVFSSAQEGATGFNEIQTAVSTCEHSPMFLAGASDISGLADDAQMLSLQYQDTPNVFHTVVVTRYANLVSIFDISRPETPANSDNLLAFVSSVGTRSCQITKSACPTNPQLSSTLVPAGASRGWLEVSDLPRLTPGEGTWTSGRDLAVAASFSGSSCEGVPLATVSGPMDRTRRTFTLIQDQNSPNNFGLDELIFQFAAETTATDFATELQENISRCQAENTTVSDPQDISATGANGETISGKTYLIASTKNGADVTYRVSILAVSNQVLYLLAESSPNYGFSSEQWIDLSIRAGQRSTQI